MRKILVLFLLIKCFTLQALVPPTWTPVPNQQFNMSVIGKIQISPGVFSLNENDILGAFVGDECRGVASPFAALGGVLFLSIGSNVQSGETVTFKIYLASTNEIVNANETIPFQNAGETGTMANPFIFTYSVQCSFTVTPISQNVNASPPGVVSFSINSTCSWSAVCNQAWCTLAQAAGSGNATLSVNCTPNTSTIQRIANITVTPQGQSPTVLTVSQAGASGPPNWNPNPYFQFNMNVIGKIQLSPGVFSLNENDLLGAFVGSECRGIASPFASVGGTLFLTIGSNLSSGENITFKVFLSSINEVVNVNEIMPFQNAGEIGTMANPYKFTIPVQNNIIVQGVTINSGQTTCYNAINSISVAGGATTFLVKNGAVVTMIAGQKISFLPGTVVQPGGYLHGSITTTNSYCSTLPSSIFKLADVESPLPITQHKSTCNIFPNPTESRFTLVPATEPSDSPVLVRIFNMMGAEVTNKQLVNSGRTEFSLENQLSGIYMVRVITDGKTETVKVVKY